MSLADRYTRVRAIGRGGMAEIWKAKVTGPSGFVKFLALKMILPDIAEDRVFASMFADEAKLAASLVHPNLVQVFDFGEIDDRLFLAMEYVAGANVDRLLNRLRREETAALPPDLAIYIALEACQGLGYAHGKTIVHRDVSPHNILVSASGEVKVADFGIARAASGVSRTEAGHVRGKLAYMSPEQIGGDKLDGRSDLFSLGLVLYEMLTGTRPFQGKSRDQLHDTIRRFAPRTDLDLSQVPESIVDLLVVLLQRDPVDRYADAGKLEAELGDRLGLSGITRARQELAQLVSRLFRDELAADTADEDDVTPARAATLEDLPPRASTAITVAEPTPRDLSEATAAATPSSASRARATASASAAPRGRRHKHTLLVVAATCIALALGVTGFVLTRRSGATTEPAGAVDRGGTLRMAISFSLESFDPFSVEHTRTRIALNQVLEPFFRISRDGEIQPWVIERSELRDDGKSILLGLRPGVYFHDHPCLPGGVGRTATAADVVFSLQQAMIHGGLALPIKGLAATGPLEVTIALTDPAPFFEHPVSSVRLLPVDLATGCEDLRRMRQPVGTGPFQFTSPPKGVRYQLVRAPRFWHRAPNGDELPYLDGIEIQPVDDFPEVLARMGRGELEIAMPSDADNVIDFSDDQPSLIARYSALGLAVASHFSRNRVGVLGLFPSAADGPLRDLRVRGALARVLDREALIATSPRKLAAPQGRFLDTRMLGYDAAAPGLGLDLDAARALLAEAGHPEGAGLRPITIGTLRDQAMGAAIAAQAAKIGLVIRVVVIAPGKASESLEKGTVDALLATNMWDMHGGEASAISYETLPVGKSPALAKLRLELLSTPERAERAPIYHRIEQTLLAELPMIPIAVDDLSKPVELFVVGKRVRGLYDPITGTGGLGDLALAWLASP